MTVLGKMRASELGAATPHERLFIDMRVFFSEPEEISRKEFMIHNPARWLDYNVK